MNRKEFRASLESIQWVEDLLKSSTGWSLEPKKLLKYYQNGQCQVTISFIDSTFLDPGFHIHVDPSYGVTFLTPWVIPLSLLCWNYVFKYYRICRRMNSIIKVLQRKESLKNRRDTWGDFSMSLQKIQEAGAHLKGDNT